MRILGKREIELQYLYCTLMEEEEGKRKSLDNSTLSLSFFVNVPPPPPPPPPFLIFLLLRILILRILIYGLTRLYTKSIYTSLLK